VSWWAKLLGQRRTVVATGPACGGKYNVPWDVYHSVPDGWDVESVLGEHRRLGGRFHIEPKAPSVFNSPWSRYRDLLYRIADGVRARDAACVELAVDYIELRFIGSYSGYIRSLLARRLKHVELTEQQRYRLSAHFLHLLKSGDRCHEFRDYLGLWSRVALPEHLTELREFTAELEGEAGQFARWVLRRLEQHAGTSALHG